MGMSASQARYISLTARMSDVEYECQQINQQRLTLSNKMNEVTERLYNMEVPTPPSKQDFMYPVYVGRSGKNSYKVKEGADGKLTVFAQGNGYFVTPSNIKGVVGDGGANFDKYLNKDETYKATDHGSDFTKCIQKNYAKMIDNKYCPEGGWSDLYDKSGNQQPISHTVNGTITKNTYVKIPNPNYNENDSSSNEFIYEYQQEQISLNELNYQDYKSTYNKTNASYTEGDVYYSNMNVNHHVTGWRKETGDGTSFESGAHYTSWAAGNWDNDFTGEFLNGLNSDVDKLWSKTFAVADGNGSYKKYTGKELSTGVANSEEIYEIKDIAGFDKKLEAIEKGATGKTVNGNSTMTVSEAQKEFSNESAFTNALSGLKNSFPDEFAENIDNFSVIVSEENGKFSFSFCQTEALEGGEVTILTPGEGDYDTEVKDAEITLDETSGVKSIKIGDVTIKMTEEQDCDEDAYDAAMDKYKLDKIEYDEEQNELNKKTSIYQRQDKQLELKLTRLDTERNALNTELEAVKKVIQDAVDKGFKTFSG